MLHMESRFVTELDKLKMTALTEKAMNNALKAFFERDVALANEVIQGDREINLLEVKVDRDCLKLMALDQPMARDLRFIVGCMRIAIDPERIAD